MKRLLLIFLLISMASCMTPYSSYDYTEPIRYPYYPTYYQPTKVIVIKKNKPKYKKRHIKVKINKHRKRR